MGELVINYGSKDKLASNCEATLFCLMESWNLALLILQYSLEPLFLGGLELFSDYPSVQQDSFESLWEMAVHMESRTDCNIQVLLFLF